MYSGRLVAGAAPTCAGRLIRLADSALFPPLPLSLSSLGFDFPQKLSGLVNTNVNTIITSKPFLPYCRSFYVYIINIYYLFSLHIKSVSIILIYHIVFPEFKFVYFTILAWASARYFLPPPRTNPKNHEW